MKAEADEIDKLYTSVCKDIITLADCERSKQKRIELLEGIKNVLEHEIEDLKR